MPRGRPRKPRLSRIHAAVDAMAPYGFPEQSVKHAVKTLLKEYGGDEGWPFIEEYSYKELIEALLRDAQGDDDQENVAQDENQPKDKSFEDISAAGTSTRDYSDSQQEEGFEVNAPADVAMPTDEVAKDGKGWKDIVLDKTAGLIDDTPNHVQQDDEEPATKTHAPCTNSAIPASPPPTNSLSTRSRRPYYGWIESDEEDPCIIFLGPASPKELVNTPNDGTKTVRKRKSRWDIGPYDA